MAWMYRHRTQHATGKPVDGRTSFRFERECEAALRARGEEAREKFERSGGNAQSWD